MFRNYAHKKDIMPMLMHVNSTISERKSITDNIATKDKKQTVSYTTHMRK